MLLLSPRERIYYSMHYAVIVANHERIYETGVSLDVGKKTDKVAEDWTAGGNQFQMTDAATGNERWPTVVRRYAGTCNSWDVGERKRWRPGRSAIRTS